MIDTLNSQERMRSWVESRLGVSAMLPQERALRMLEEAIELAQAIGVESVQAMKVLVSVYSKPPGRIHQEFGGAAITLLACAEGCGEDLGLCIASEMYRIESLPMEKFRERQILNAQHGIGRPPDVAERPGA